MEQVARFPRSGTVEPFLSYDSEDEPLVERVAQRLLASRMLPVFDRWWLRSFRSRSLADSEEEIRAGITVSNAFVRFQSAASERSSFVKFEDDHGLWSQVQREETGPYRMMCVRIDQPGRFVSHWYEPVLDWDSNKGDDSAFDALVCELVDALAPDGQVASLQGLRGVGEVGIEAMLDSESAETRVLGLRAAGANAASHPERVDRALAARAGDRSPAVREQACYALASFGSSSAVRDGLIAALDDDFEGVQFAGAFLLAHLYREELDMETANGVAAALGKHLDGTDSKNTSRCVRSIRAIGRIGPNAGAAEGALVRSMGAAEDPWVAALACTALSRLPATPSLVAAIETIAADGGSRITRHAIRTLGRLGADAEPAVPTIADIATRSSEELRAAALASLWRIGVASVEALSACLHGLASEHPAVHQEAMRALVRLKVDTDDLAAAILAVRSSSRAFQKWTESSLAKEQQRIAESATKLEELQAARVMARVVQSRVFDTLPEPPVGN